MRLGSLFAGIGGFDLAARWMGWTTAWVSEIEPYASAVLKKHFPEAPNLGDITQLNGHTAPPIDMLVGGFPCQDISFSGRGEGIEGSRSGLWSHYARLIGETHPKYVLAENVSALRTRGLDRVLQDLAALGYDAEFHCVPASIVGAPHQRDRIWILAYPRRPRRPSGFSGSNSGKEGDSGITDDRSLLADVRWEAAPWYGTEPAVVRMVHGVPSRVDRLRCLGNAIVPQVALTIFQAIERYELLQSGGS